jgi:hypothetical protein
MSDDKDWLKERYAEWFSNSIPEIYEAGGSPDLVKKFPTELLDILVRNTLQLNYKGVK